MRAFILCRPFDMPIARACQKRMKELGWIASVMVDPREWETLPDDVVCSNYSTLGHGMYGNDCAANIVSGILNHSNPGDIVMKMDCDVWLSDEANEWFTSAVKAKGLRVTLRGNLAWGGAWSATYEHLLRAQDKAKTFKRCRCPESFANLKALALTEPGIEYHPTKVTQWAGGDRGVVSTLPIFRRQNRLTEGLALFNTIATTT